MMRFATLFLVTGFMPYKSGDRALHWENDGKRVPLTLVQKDSPLTTQAFRAVVETAFSKWTQASSEVPAAGVTDVVQSEAAEDAHHIKFVAGSWPFDPNALAVTVFSYRKSTGALVDADIFINAAGPCLSESPNKTCYDLQSVLTHEAGHFMGLDHNAQDKETVMYPSAMPGDVSKRVLTADDMAGVASTYGGVMAEVPATAADTAAPELPVLKATPQQNISRQGCNAASSSFGWWFLLALGFARRARGAVALLLAMASPALASSVARESLGQQMERSDAVFVARSIAKRSYFDVAYGFIVTEHTLAVDHCVRGSCAPRMTFRTLGGEVGDLVTRVSGESEPAPNEQALFVASKRNNQFFEATAFGQGVLNFDRELGMFRSKAHVVRMEEVLK